MNASRVSAFGGLLLALALTAAGAADSDLPGPAVGARFPHALEAQDQHGQAQSLEALMGENGIAVLFQRSADWCPFCKAQLVDMNAHLGRFEALGLSVVSITVDDVSKIAAFTEQQNIGYTMLADPEGEIVDAMGIRDPEYPVGSFAYGVPRPVLYIVDTEGTIRARYMEPTYQTSPDLEVVLEETAALDL